MSDSKVYHQGSEDSAAGKVMPCTSLLQVKSQAPYMVPWALPVISSDLLQVLEKTSKKMLTIRAHFNQPTWGMSHNKSETFHIRCAASTEPTLVYARTSSLLIAYCKGTRNCLNPLWLEKKETTCLFEEPLLQRTHLGSPIFSPTDPRWGTRLYHKHPFEVRSIGHRCSLYASALWLFRNVRNPLPCQTHSYRVRK